MACSLVLLAVAAHSSAPSARTSPGGDRIRLIIDTDIGGGGCNDVDDVVSLSVSLSLCLSLSFTYLLCLLGMPSLESLSPYLSAELGDYTMMSPAMVARQNRV